MSSLGPLQPHKASIQLHHSPASTSEPRETFYIDTELAYSCWQLRQQIPLLQKPEIPAVCHIDVPLRIASNTLRAVLNHFYDIEPLHFPKNDSELAIQVHVLICYWSPLLDGGQALQGLYREASHHIASPRSVRSTLDLLENLHELNRPDLCKALLNGLNFDLLMGDISACSLQSLLFLIRHLIWSAEDSVTAATRWLSEHPELADVAKKEFLQVLPWAELSGKFITSNLADNIFLTSEQLRDLCTHHFFSQNGAAAPSDIPSYFSNTRSSCSVVAKSNRNLPIQLKARVLQIGNDIMHIYRELPSFFLVTEEKCPDSGQTQQHFFAVCDKVLSSARFFQLSMSSSMSEESSKMIHFSDHISTQTLEALLHYFYFNDSHHITDTEMMRNLCRTLDYLQPTDSKDGARLQNLASYCVQGLAYDKNKKSRLNSFEFASAYGLDNLAQGLVFHDSNYALRNNCQALSKSALISLMTPELLSPDDCASALLSWCKENQPEDISLIDFATSENLYQHVPWAEVSKYELDELQSAGLLPATIQDVLTPALASAQHSFIEQQPTLAPGHYSYSLGFANFPYKLRTMGSNGLPDGPIGGACCSILVEGSRLDIEFSRAWSLNQKFRLHVRIICDGAISALNLQIGKKAGLQCDVRLLPSQIGNGQVSWHGTSETYEDSMEFATFHLAPSEMLFGQLTVEMGPPSSLSTTSRAKRNRSEFESGNDVSDW